MILVIFFKKYLNKMWNDTEKATPKKIHIIWLLYILYSRNLSYQLTHASFTRAPVESIITIRLPIRPDSKGRFMELAATHIVTKINMFLIFTNSIFSWSFQKLRSSFLSSEVNTRDKNNVHDYFLIIIEFSFISIICLL